MSIYSIYRITNIITQKVYIGYTSSPELRWSQHRSASQNQNSRNHQAVHKSMHKHGIDNFAFEVIYQSWDMDHTLNHAEPLFIQEYASFGPGGYNLTAGGGSCYRYTDEARTRIGNSKRGISLSDSHKANIGDANRGKKKPEDFGQRISLAKMGVKRPQFSDQWIANMRKATAGANNPNFGKSTPDEVKMKQSEKAKRRPVVQCPHCMKEGTLNGMKQWHFDRCKFRP